MPKTNKTGTKVNQGNETKSCRVTYYCFYLGLFSSLFVAFLGLKVYNALQPAPRPRLDEPYWGPNGPVPDDDSIRPFKLTVDNETIEDLKYRLKNRRKLTPSLEGIAQEYGVNTNLLNNGMEYWLNTYLPKWNERLEYINKYPQFKTKVQGLDIHFVHAKPTKKVKTLPMLMLHGWPLTFMEYYYIIPKLLEPTKIGSEEIAFEVIVPSLPGFVFSDRAAKPGMGAAEAAVIMKNLMNKLGFEKYIVHGGDWGAVIAADMAAMFPEKLIGLHSNMCVVQTPLAHLKVLIGSLFPEKLIPKENFRKKLYPLTNTLYTLMIELAYMHLQVTKPDSIGVGLTDSPMGLAGYTLEKAIFWTNRDYVKREDGGILEKYSYDDLFDIMMLYWITGSITPSMRFYAESLSIQEYLTGITSAIVETPTACVAYVNEVLYQPEWVLKDKFVNLIQYPHIDDGGHIPALELPQVFFDDLITAVDKFINGVKKV